MEILQLLIDTRASLTPFDYDHYPDAFEAFRSRLSAVKELQEERLTAEEIPKRFAAYYATHPPRQQKKEIDADRQVLALFFTPAAGMNGGYAAALAEEFCELWARQYPKYRYYSSTYEKIMAGFDANLLGLPLRKSSRK